jgi:2-keto-3-deoxy-6-phosphogluconate aldolase
MNEIPLPLVHIGLSSLKLLPSDQFRVLEMIKMLAQLPRHANAIIEAGGVSQLCTLFLEFYKPGSVLFSTFKNLVLEVCIALSQWTTAAQRMVTKLD